MAENKNGNYDSLAAFLHNGAQEIAPESVKPAPPPEKPAAVKPVKPAPKPERAERLEPKKPLSDSGSLSDVLFSLDSKKGSSSKKAEEPRKRAQAVPVIDESDDYDAQPNAPFYNVNEDVSADYDDYTDRDNAPTQMLDMSMIGKGNYATDQESDEEREERKEISRLKVKYEKQRLRSRTFAFILVGVFLSFVIIGVSAYISTYIVTFALDLTGIATNDFRLDISIPENADTQLVAAVLQENNIIKSAKFFKFFADLTHKTENFQPGTYTLSSTMSYSTLFSVLQDQSIDYKTVTIRIVEGMTSSEIGKLLEENKVCYAKDFEQYYMNLQNKYDFERRVGEEASKFYQLEGYLFPDTYEFYAILDIPDIEYDSEEKRRKAEDAQRKKELKYAEEAAEKMYSNFDDKITKLMYKQMGEMGLTLDDVVTLASMVQREAAGTEDMYYVASVFMNRINNIDEYPHLQSDVTALYVENEIKPNIDTKSTRYNRVTSAYNSYVCKGIPAGPICNPGLDAINAVLNPAETNYYFFCANPETGDVYYASTQEEHEQNLVLAGIRNNGEGGSDVD